MSKYLRLMRFDKPIGIYLLLWPTLWALFLAANGIPSIKLLIIFILGVVLMRAAGCVINDYVDRDVDKLVERTKKRPITTGEVATKEALYLFVLLIVVAFLLVLFTNYFTIKLAFIALALTMLYPFTKRWIYLPQFILGMAFAMSIPMAFAATNNSVPISAWLIFIANIIWSIVYDTIYAMIDVDDDLKIGVKSSAILFSKYDLKIILLLQIILLIMLCFIGITFDLNIVYYIFIIFSAILMVHHQFLIKNREKDNCLRAFLSNHYIGVFVFIGIALSVFN